MNQIKSARPLPSNNFMWEQTLSRGNWKPTPWGHSEKIGFQLRTSFEFSDPNRLLNERAHSPLFPRPDSASTLKTWAPNRSRFLQFGWYSHFSEFIQRLRRVDRAEAGWLGGRTGIVQNSFMQELVEMIG